MTLEYTFSSNLENGNWYGIVYNINNSYQSTGAYVYKLNSKSNTLTSMSVADTLVEVMDQNIDMTSTIGWVSTKKWSLMPGKLALTNVRLFKKVVGKDQHKNILQQYIVRDNHLAYIIDNAIPSIQLRKYNQNR